MYWNFNIVEPDIWFAYGDGTRARLVVFEISGAVPVSIKWDIFDTGITFSIFANDPMVSDELVDSLHVRAYYQQGAYFRIATVQGDNREWGFSVPFDSQVTEATYLSFNSHNDYVAFNPVVGTFNSVSSVFTGEVNYVELIQAIRDDTAQNATFFQNVGNWFASLFSKIDTGFSNVGTWFNNLSSNLSAWFEGLKIEVNKGFNAVGTWFADLKQSLSVWWDGLYTKLDSLIDGGAAGDALKDSAGEMSSTAGEVSGGVSEMDKVEQEYMGSIDANMDTIQSGSDLSFISIPLIFISGYVSKAAAAIPGSYLTYYTLPMFLGIFFFMVQHNWRSSSSPPPSSGSGGDRV